MSINISSDCKKHRQYCSLYHLPGLPRRACSEAPTLRQVAQMPVFSCCLIQLAMADFAMASRDSPLLSLWRATTTPCKFWDFFMVHKVHIPFPIHIKLEASMWSICQAIWNLYIPIWSITDPLLIYVNHGHQSSCDTLLRFTLYSCMLDITV